MIKSPSWSERLAESKIFKYSIWGAFFLFIAIIVLIIFILGSFLFKIYIQDYWIDDGELRLPIESIHIQDQ